MRKLALSLTPIALTLAVVVACEDSSTVNGGDLNIDSGTNGYDANVPPYDGATPPPDAAPDAPVTPLVRVTVTGAAGPKSGVDVVFHTAAGAVIETLKTGADGTATHLGSDAAMVSALLATGSNRHIVTWTGVEVGDNLKLKDPYDSSGNSVGNYDVTLVNNFADSGATNYYVDGPCGGSQTYGTGTSLGLWSDCTKAKNAVLVTARDWNYAPLGHAFKKGIDGITDGGNLQVNITDWKVPATLTLNVANVPSETYVPRRLLEIADGTGFYNEASSSTDGSTITFKIADGFADAYQASIFGSSEYGTTSITKRAGTAAPMAFDYATLLPTITDATINNTDPRRAVIAWTSGSMAGTDGGIVQFQYGGPEDANYRWSFVVPPGATTVTAPEIPTSLESFLPYAADSGVESWTGSPEVLFVEASVIPNYALFRSEQGTLLQYGSSLGDYDFPALPVDGTYKATSFGGQDR